MLSSMLSKISDTVSRILAGTGKDQGDTGVFQKGVLGWWHQPQLSVLNPPLSRDN